MTTCDEKEEWFAIKTRHDLRAEAELEETCQEVFYPKEEIARPGGRSKLRPFIPRVLFVKATRRQLLQLEQLGRRDPEGNLQFWIYRYPAENAIRVIPESSIHLLRLLTSDVADRCEIYGKDELRPDRKVRVIGGPFAGYEGQVVRVKKNRHVVVRIEGICMVLLPFIHPDLLQPL